MQAPEKKPTLAELAAQGNIRDGFEIPPHVAIFEKKGYKTFEAEWYFIDHKWVFLYFAKKGKDILSESSNILCNDKCPRLYMNHRKINLTRFRRYFGKLQDRINKKYLEGIIWA